MPPVRANLLRRILARFLLALSIALAAGVQLLPARPQAAQQAPADPRTTIRTRVELVVVPVTVKNSSGSLIADLRQDEFRVLEDNVEQRITLFSADGVPLSAVLLVDDDLKTKPAEQVKKTLIAMAGAFGADDEVAVAKFDAFYTQVLDFTTNNDDLVDALKRMTLDSTIPGVGSGVMTSPPMVNNQPVAGAPIPTQATQGLSNKHIDDALYAAGEALRARARERRKVVLLVTDGVNAKNNTNSFDDTLKLLLSSDVSVYAVGVDAAILNRLASVLARYAHATGGDVYHAADPSALPDFYSRVAEQARYQYTLGYVPTGTDRTNNYHSIEVRVRRPGLTVLTRDGYYLVPTR